jgi:hypothetical protein
VVGASAHPNTDLPPYSCEGSHSAAISEGTDWPGAWRLQLVDALDLDPRRALLEDRVLDPLHLLLDRIDDGEIVVDDEIHQRVEDEAFAAGEALWRALAARPDIGVGKRRAVPYRDDIALAGEDVRLAEGDLLLGKLAVWRTMKIESS